jgi:hypothetical protein
MTISKKSAREDIQMEQWYYRTDDQKIGPFSEDELLQMIEPKLISSSAQVCSESLPDWTDASEAEAFGGSTGMTRFFPTPRNVHPWLRYWARMVDVGLFSFFIIVVIVIAYPPAGNLPDPLMNMLMLALYILVEPILLSTIGTTVGKAFFGIRLRKPDGGKLSFGNALARSCKVAFKGLAIGVPFVSLFTMLNAYNRLSSKGITSWDLEERVLVTHKKLGIVRMILLVLVITGMVALMVLGIVSS